MNRRVLISCVHLQRRIDTYAAEFDARGLVIEAPPIRQQLEEDWLVANIGRFSGVIAGDDPITVDVLQAGVEGALVGIVKWGIGVDAIDLEAARQLGVHVENTPGMFADEVADVAMGYVIALARELHRIHNSVVGGGWYKPVGVTLRGKTLGVIGLGSIGLAIAKRASAFGMSPIGCDPHTTSDASSQVNVASMDEVLRNADFLVLACSLTRENRGMINADALSSMKPGSYLVNVARGALVVEQDLCRALASGHMRAAALDVFESEPLPVGSPLREFDQCVWGSHNGSNTVEAVVRVNRLAVDKLFRLLDKAVDK